MSKEASDALSREMARYVIVVWGEDGQVEVKSAPAPEETQRYAVLLVGQEAINRKRNCPWWRLYRRLTR